jgi:hypothetical protein
VTDRPRSRQAIRRSPRRRTTHNGNNAVFELAPIGQAAVVWDSSAASEWAISSTMFVPAAL